MSSLSRWVPILEWLPVYQRPNLRGDVIAGLTTGMMLIPQAMSYALLAGLPPIIGLYASILPIVAYAIFGTSRQLAVGPAAMIALLVTSEVGRLADAGSEQYVVLAIFLSLMVGVIQFLMGALRLGFITNFMSHPVISGFTSAAALIIGFSQLGHLLGISLPRTENIAKIIHLTIQQLALIHLPTLVIGLGGVILLVVLKKISPLLPGPMIVVIISTLLVWGLNLDHMGVRTVGQVPPGLPIFSVPDVDSSQWLSLLPIALTIAFMGFIESIAVARKIAREKRYEIDANKELVALGIANIVASFFKAMPVAGGFGRTAVNNSAGANTALASLITAAVIAIALVFFTPLFYFIPKAILGSIIMLAVASLVDFQEIKHLWKVKKEDLGLLGLTFIATLTIGVKEGIFIGIGASLLWFVVKTTRPHYAVLGRLPGTRDYRNVLRHSVETDNGVLVLRFDAQFYYGNVSFLKETIKKHLHDTEGKVHAVVIDACSINQLDSSADTALHELLDEYRVKQIEFYFSYVKGPVLDVMSRSGFVQRVGSDHFFNNTHDAVIVARERQVAEIK
ncbi:SulP family inorganic anion transporter [Gynuella sunshinyii]|nr:solute carrier family 26 protein [Gynuella sunshinyii]